MLPADKTVLIADDDQELAKLLGARCRRMGLNVRLAHVESGLRSFDRTMPEEINRTVTDQLSDYLFIHSEEAEANLEEAKEQYEAQVKQANEILNPLEEELEKLESKEESERTATEKRRIRTLKSQIKSQEAAHFSNLQHYKQRSQRSIDSVVKELTGRVDHERLGRRPDSPLGWPADGRAATAAGLAAGGRGGR